MLRMYLLQVWFNLSDEGIEDAIYDSYAFRQFMCIDFSEEQVPDAATLLKSRHLLEKNHLGEQMFRYPVNLYFSVSETNRTYPFNIVYSQSLKSL